MEEQRQAIRIKPFPGCQLITEGLLAWLEWPCVLQPNRCVVLTQLGTSPLDSSLGEERDEMSRESDFVALLFGHIVLSSTLQPCHCWTWFYLIKVMEKPCTNGHVVPLASSPTPSLGLLQVCENEKKKDRLLSESTESFWQFLAEWNKLRQP